MTFPPSLSFNDLVGLQHQWAKRPADGSGFTDCFALCMEVRRRLGLHDFMEEFGWVYEQCQPEEISNRQIVKWLWKNAKQITEPRPGAVFYLPSPNGSLAMAVITDNQNCLLLGPGKKVISLPFAKVAKGKYYWAE